MPGCVLRAGGKNFAVDKFLAQASFSPCAVFRRGELKSSQSNRRHTKSSFNAVVSKASGYNWSAQVRGAICFLRKHRASIEQLGLEPGVEGIELDFGLWNRATPEKPWPSFYLDSTLLRLCCELGLSVQLSFYEGG